jgi:hypothetical protein
MSIKMSKKKFTRIYKRKKKNFPVEYYAARKKEGVLLS